MDFTGEFEVSYGECVTPKELICVDDEADVQKGKCVAFDG